MPNTIYIAKERSRDGIDITWTPTAQRIDISGWYDGFVGIEGDSFSLREFFEALGITEKDCKKAWKREER
jgi:hypothetical protein